MNSPPSSTELNEIRKKLKKRKLPKVYPDMAGVLAELGEFEFKEIDGGFKAEWLLFGKEKKSAIFADLCNLETLELNRLELGWLVADIIEQYAQDMLHAIPGPNEAMKEFSHFKKISDNWRHWSQVAPGSMIF